MNTAQQIQLVILKFMFYDIFESTGSEEEKTLIQGLKQFLNLRIEHEQTHGQTVLVWNFKKEQTVACYVDEYGFKFSEVRFYKASTGVMKEKTFTETERQHFIVVDEQIAKLKTMFRAYSADAEACFN